MSYNIETYINKLGNIKMFEDVVTVLLLVKSQSNIIHYGAPVYLKNEEDLALYFPDSLITENTDLQIAKRLLGNGYNVLALNVYKAKNIENTLLYIDSNSQIKGIWTNQKIDLGFLNRNIVDTDNLAVVIDFNTIKEDFYVIFEHYVNKQQWPCYFYSSQRSISDVSPLYWKVDHSHRVEIPDNLYSQPTNGLVVLNSVDVNGNPDNLFQLNAYLYNYQDPANNTDTLADYGFGVGDSISSNTGLILQKNGTYAYYFLTKEVFAETKISSLPTPKAQTSTNIIIIDGIEYIIPFGATTDDSAAKLLAQNFINELSKEGYTCSYDESLKKLYIAFPYSFHSYELQTGLDISYSNSFQQTYLVSSINPDNKICLVKSKFYTDINDLDISFYQKGSIYYCDIIKRNTDSYINKVESYSNIDILTLYNTIQDQSKYIELTIYRTDVFPEGQFSLKQLNEGSIISYSHYIDALNILNDIIIEYDLSYVFNIVYEPDVREYATTTEQKKYVQQIIQIIINNLFQSIDTPILKVMSYLGDSSLIENHLNAYMEDLNVLDNGETISLKEMYLHFLTSNSLKGVVNNQIALLSEPMAEPPYFLNVIKENYIYNTIDTIKTINGSNIYDLRDYLVVSCMNSLLKNIQGIVTETDIINQKNKVEQYYLKYFGYSPNITISSFVVKENIATIELSYNTETLNEINTIELVLNLEV